jgi:ankyrin repeat protein
MAKPTRSRADQKRSREYEAGELAKDLKLKNIDALDEEGMTALMRHARSDLWYYDAADEETCVDGVRQLLDKGANVNAIGKDGWTALHWAVRDAGAPAVIKLLLEKGAKPNVVTSDFGYSPLVYAAERGRLSIVKMLLEAGATIDSKVLKWAKKASVKKLLDEVTATQTTQTARTKSKAGGASKAKSTKR